jgi:hypothetical protein
MTTQTNRGELTRDALSASGFLAGSSILQNSGTVCYTSHILDLVSRYSHRIHLPIGMLIRNFVAWQGKDLTACAIDTQYPQKAILGRSSGKISMLDVQTGQLLETVPSNPCLCSNLQML